jgi:hypothetical protein
MWERVITSRAAAGDPVVESRRGGTVVRVRRLPETLSLKFLFLAHSATKRFPALSMVSRAGAPRTVDAGP